MADWLEITNTFINLQNRQRLNEISAAQQQVANQMMGTEIRKQRDNAILSQLVDIFVKARQRFQDQEFLDAFFSAELGVIAYMQLYSQIVDADTKLKASDIQARLIDSIRSAVSDTSINKNIQLSLGKQLLFVNNTLRQTILQLKQSQHKFVWLDPEEDWTADVGEEFTPIQNLVDPSSNSIMFLKGKLYKVVEVNTTVSEGFYLIDELGKKFYALFGKEGGARLFGFFDPPIPSIDNEIAIWELCNKLFSDEFLLGNLKSIRSEVLDIYYRALEQAKLSKPVLEEAVSQYRHLRQEIINQAQQLPQIKAVNKSNGYVEISILIGGFVFLLAIILLRNC